VILLTLPAFIAVWSGWVGLGEKSGFGVVRPLPGIADQFVINSSITLPIGMEVYAAYALHVWLSGLVTGRAARFAACSAIGSLIVGAAGQVAYHLLEAAHILRAPWWITTVVACIPVAVLGMGAALARLVRAAQTTAPDHQTDEVRTPRPVAAPTPVRPVWPAPVAPVLIQWTTPLEVAQPEAPTESDPLPDPPAEGQTPEPDHQTGEAETEGSDGGPLDDTAALTLLRRHRAQTGQTPSITQTQTLLRDPRTGKPAGKSRSIRLRNLLTGEQGTDDAEDDDRAARAASN
jgi:hypothetical protein